MWHSTIIKHTQSFLHGFFPTNVLSANTSYPHFFFFKYSLYVLGLRAPWMHFFPGKSDARFYPTIPSNSLLHLFLATRLTGFTLNSWQPSSHSLLLPGVHTCFSVLRPPITSTLSSLSHHDLVLCSTKNRSNQKRTSLQVPCLSFEGIYAHMLPSLLLLWRHCLCSFPRPTPKLCI